MAVVTNMSYAPSSNITALASFSIPKGKESGLRYVVLSLHVQDFFWFPSRIPDCYKEGQRLSHYNHPYPVYMEEEEKDFARLRTQIKILLRACQISYSERKSTVLLSMYSLNILLDEVR